MVLMEFDVVFEEQEEGGYTVYVPALPGCISQGETREEAEKNIREAISLYLEETKKEVALKLSKAVSVGKTRVKVYA